MLNLPEETRTGDYEIHIRFPDGDDLGYMTKDRDMALEFLEDWQNAGWKMSPDTQSTDEENAVWYFVAEEKGDLGMSSPEFKESLKNDIC